MGICHDTYLRKLLTSCSQRLGLVANALSLATWIDQGSSIPPQRSVLVHLLVLVYGVGMYRTMAIMPGFTTRGRHCYDSRPHHRSCGTVSLAPK